MIPAILRVDGDLPQTLRISGDEGQLAEFLSHCRPLCVHYDDGEELVRWAVPLGLVKDLEKTKCPCCGCTALPLQDGGIALDVPYADVPWEALSDFT